MTLRCVPLEPTEEMVMAAEIGDREYTDKQFGKSATAVQQAPFDHFSAMVAAAPPPPADIEAALELAEAWARYKCVTKSGKEAIKMAIGLRKSWGRE